jgi:peptide alpha-N-acetyltransferase
VGVIIGRLFEHAKTGYRVRGYIGMLTVKEDYRRKHGIGSGLVQRELEAFRIAQAHQIVLEAEVTNMIALDFYRKLGFIRDKFLPRYYLNGSDAYRLKLILK